VALISTDGETITVTVTNQKTQILGVPVVVVTDVAKVDGEITEDTIDCHAQDV